MSSFDPLRRRPYRTLWLGNMAGNFAGLLQLVASSWIMLQLGASQTMIALTQAAVALPMMLGAFFVGVLADCCDRRILMLWAQLVVVLTSMVFATFAISGWLTPGLVLCLTFMIGCGQTLNTPVWYSTIGTLVPDEELAEALSLNSMAFHLIRSIGPAISGVILTFGGTEYAYLLAILFNSGLFIVVARWRSPRGNGVLTAADFGAALRSGLSYFFASSLVWRSTLRTAMFCFSASAVMALLPIIATVKGDGSALLYGGLLGCFGAGAAATTFFTGWIRRRISAARVSLCSFLSFALSALVLADFRWVPVCGIGLGLAGGSWLCMLSLTNARLQLATPKAVSGRVVALFMTGIYTGVSAGSWFWGVVSECWGPSAALIASAVALLFSSLILQPRPEHAQQDR